MRVLILGATGGIGRQVVAQLQGAHELFLVARSEAPLAELADETGSHHVAGDAGISPLWILSWRQ